MVDSVTLVQESWDKVAQQEDDFTNRFYETLFEKAPHVQELFPSEMREQKKKLFDTLNFIIRNLRNPERIFINLKDLGDRHRDYGAKPEYYPLVGESIIQALRDCLEADFTDEVKAAWLEMYEIMSEHMIARYQN